MEMETEQSKKKSILVTGAGGFIGGFIVAEALERGYDTWAAVRSSTSRRFLKDVRIHFVELDFTDEDGLRAALQGAMAQNGGPWDYVVHNLGATKAVNYQEFQRVNYGYLKLMVDTLKALDAVPSVFLLMSSLSVMGMGDERGYTPFKPSDEPRPNTRCGMSKAMAENYLRMQGEGFPYTIVRCTGVYGPHERDYYLMIKSIKHGVDFSVGFRKQMLTFIYVKDLARAVMEALEAGAKRRAYFISEERAYTQQEFRSIVKEELGKRHVVPVVAPIWLLRVVCAVSSFISKFTLKPATLNNDKFNILRQRNWLCDTTDTERDLHFKPQYSLREGLREAIAWYREAGWL